MTYPVVTEKALYDHLYRMQSNGEDRYQRAAEISITGYSLHDTTMIMKAAMAGELVTQSIRAVMMTKPAKHLPHWCLTRRGVIWVENRFYKDLDSVKPLVLF